MSTWLQISVDDEPVLQVLQSLQDLFHDLGDDLLWKRFRTGYFLVRLEDSPEIAFVAQLVDDQDVILRFSVIQDFDNVRMMHLLQNVHFVALDLV